MSSHPSLKTTSSPNHPTLYDVAIIGAGPAGIICAKTLLETCGPNLNIIVLEESKSVGGLWNREHRHYPQDNDTSPQCTCQDLDANTNVKVDASSQPVYENLHTNLLKDLTSFVDVPFDSKIEHFPPSETVLDYLKSYVSHHGLETCIRLNERVVKCSKMTKEGEENIWIIDTQKSTTLSQGTSIRRKEYMSKRLLVCVGHFRQGFVPSVRGISHYKGTLLHSSAYSSPDDFHNKIVLIVGGGLSGCDIAGILATRGHCARIIVSV
mmetsp:Transcript_29115/g.42527  ORF Transcript_29115/g.42527 Transcript_29115/m.42527 type:complete len:266 (-) Transcript_29115:681-1478(-)